MSRVWQWALIIFLGWIVFFGTIVVMGVIRNQINPDTPTNTPEQALIQAFETCRYGSEQFYVAREVEDASELAISVCQDSVKDMGTERFIKFFAPVVTDTQVILSK